MSEISSFEQNALEEDIKELESKIAGVEKPGERREVLREHLATKINTFSPTGFVPKPTSQSDDKSSNILPNYMQKYSDEERLIVEELIDLAIHKGIEVAVKEAAKKGNFFLDAFHDALTDKLHNYFVSKGIIK